MPPAGASPTTRAASWNTTDRTSRSTRSTSESPLARNAALLLGHETEATAWENRASTLKAAINSQLFDGTSYLTKSAAASASRLAPPSPSASGLYRRTSLAQVIAWLRKQPAHVGGYGGYTYYQGAYEAGGLGDLIVSDLIRYQYMLAGNRTIWESFARPSPDNETNHAWTAYPAELFPRYIAGIAPTGPAFSTFSIKPETRGLTLRKPPSPRSAATSPAIGNGFPRRNSASTAPFPATPPRWFTSRSMA